MFLAGSLPPGAGRKYGKTLCPPPQNHELLKGELEALGFEFLVQPGYRLPMLNAVIIPRYR